MSAIVSAKGLTRSYGKTIAVDNITFDIPAGRIVGLIGPNGSGKTTALKAILGLSPFEGELKVLGLDPRTRRDELMQQVCFIADVAILPRWARVDELISMMSGLNPNFSAERARQLLKRTSVGLRDKVKTLSKGMMVQAHLALTAAIDARLMILDEPTLGLDVLSRKAFYEMLIDEWCDGDRSVLISTHQVEEIESLLSDVLMLNEGKLVLSISLEDMDRRFVALSHDSSVAESMAAAHPLLRYRTGPGPAGNAAIFDGTPPEHVMALGQRVRPNLVDLFVALTRKPELDRTQF